MSNMFAYCKSLQKLDISNFDITNVPVDLTGLKNKDKNKTINILAGLDSLCAISISRTNKFEGISLLTNGYTNTWINVGNGTEKESENSLSLDSPKLPGTLQDIVDNYKKITKDEFIRYNVMAHYEEENGNQISPDGYVFVDKDPVEVPVKNIAGYTCTVAKSIKINDIQPIQLKY